jgi:hypothetical protein
MYGVSLSSAGPSPYPECNPGQTDLTAQVPNFLKGNILDVLFANSTQIVGGEQIVFPKGMAFKLTTDGREVATTIHWLNLKDTAFTSEIVYDFFTASDDQITQEIVPFVYDNQGFRIPAHTNTDISTTCDLLHSANIVSLMPHTHVATHAFDAELVASDGTTKSILHDGAIDGSSVIKVFDTPISTEGFTKIHHTCSVNNALSDPVVWGIGQNEMCTLFGYLYPPQSQMLGVVLGPAQADGNGGPCTTLDLGVHRQ